MTCPDWRPLLEHRLGAGSDPPPGWPEALLHLDRCPDCRRGALALDPTLVFAAPPALEIGDDEVESIRRNVAALRRARQVERATGWRRRRRAAVAGAAALVAGLALLPTHTAQRPGATPAADAGRAQAAEPPAIEPDRGPLVEALDLPAARIYQLGGEDLPVVMIIHPTLDV